MHPASDFYQAFRGHFSSLLRWEDLDAFWRVVRARADAGWYLYAVGMPLPQQPASAEQVEKFIDSVNALLRSDHDEEYCGIVYVDNKADPDFIKIFDPHHLGVACGFSRNPPMPGWVMCRIPPKPLKDNRVLPAQRERWWRELWTSSAAS
jgi:hypothetical protein